MGARQKPIASAIILMRPYAFISKLKKVPKFRKTKEK